MTAGVVPSSGLFWGKQTRRSAFSGWLKLGAGEAQRFSLPFMGFKGAKKVQLRLEISWNQHKVPDPLFLHELRVESSFTWADACIIVWEASNIPPLFQIQSLQTDWKPFPLIPVQLHLEAPQLKLNMVINDIIIHSVLFHMLEVLFFFTEVCVQLDLVSLHAEIITSRCQKLGTNQ